MEKENKKIDFYCKKCRKSLKTSYVVTGNVDSMVMSGIMMRCHTHKCVRTMILKEVTEGQLVSHTDKEGKVFL